MGAQPTLDGSEATVDADRGGKDERAASEVPTRGALIGRYVVLSLLGRGAMGVVVAAYDPQLDRRVALKLLRPQKRQGSTARARLQREALALARLNHPNVVAVHDVGVHAGHVFVAMELVAGRTLREWMDETERPRRWPEALPVFEAAARGLAAAHRAGLVHRDFKPENVMIGDDGRVRVMDFGLARPGDSLDSLRDSESLGSGSRSADVLEGSLTRTGALLGTPAYMAPEQFAGGIAGPHSDQFSLCVTLFEALYGARPFEGATPGELAYAVTKGRPRRMPSERRVPAWIHRAIMRGLSTRVAERFPSMDALASALAAGETRGRRRRQGVALLGVGGLVAAGFGWQHWEEAQRVEHCERAGDALDSVWSPSRRAAVATGIERTELPYGRKVVEEVLPLLDRYAASWREAATAACTAHTIDRTWNAARLDKAQWCLDSRLARLDALADAFEASKPGAVRQAITLVDGWEPPPECVEARHLDLAPDPPPLAQREDVTPLMRELARIGLRIERRETAAASLVLEDVARRAEALGWAPLQASVLTMQGHAASLMQRFDIAERLASDAYMLASESGAWHEAAAAANMLIYGIGQDPTRLNEARTWARHAQVANKHGGFDRPYAQARIEDNLGMALLAAGKLDEARATFERSLERTASDLGEDSPSTHWARFHLAQVGFHEGDYASAKRHYEDALAVLLPSHGPDHPTVARMQAGVGEAAMRLGDDEAAERHFIDALRTLQRDGLTVESSVARVQLLLGTVQHRLGKLELARDTLEESMRGYARIRGATHPDVTHPMARLASVVMEQGETARAKELQEDALAIRLEALGAEHPLVAVSYLDLGELAVQTGDMDEGCAHLERAMPLMERGYGPRHPNTGVAHLTLAQAYETKGERPRAQAEAQRALDLLEEKLGEDHPHALAAREVLDRTVATSPAPR